MVIALILMKMGDVNRRAAKADVGPSEIMAPVPAVDENCSSVAAI